MNEIYIAIVVIFLPGILATAICDKITFHSKWTSFKFGLYAFLLGISSYILVQIVYNLFDLTMYLNSGQGTFRQLAVWASLLNGGKLSDLREVLFATIAAAPLAFFVSWVVNARIINRVARAIRVTTKYGDDNAFSFFMNTDDVSWVYVRDTQNKLTYQGQIAVHSEANDLQELVLCNVSVYDYETSGHCYDAPYVYLARKPGEFTIECIPESKLEKKNG